MSENKHIKDNIYAIVKDGLVVEYKKIVFQSGQCIWFDCKVVEIYWNNIVCFCLIFFLNNTGGKPFAPGSLYDALIFSSTVAADKPDVFVGRGDTL